MGFKFRESGQKGAAALKSWFAIPASVFIYSPLNFKGQVNPRM